MRLYHELPAQSLTAALHSGIQRKARGEKGKEAAIVKTDKFLDTHRPLAARRAGLSRANNVYAYLGDDTSVINIRSGTPTPLREYTNQKDHCLLEIRTSVKHCFISDLDLYDEVKRAIGSDKAVSLAVLAARYWSAVTPLSEFIPGTVKRPEVMVTRSIGPSEITVC